MTEKIDLIYTSKEGRIGFQVDNAYYEYRLDTSYFPAVLKMNQSQPSKALRFVRKISPGLIKFRKEIKGYKLISKNDLKALYAKIHVASSLLEIIEVPDEKLRYKIDKDLALGILSKAKQIIEGVMK